MFDGNSGVYAVRKKKTRKVEYVGESHTGRGWKTLLRHFQDHTGSFADRSEYTRTTADDLECAVWVTSVGRRAKTSGDQKALDLQAKLIRRLKPSHNIDDGKAYGLCPHGTSSRLCAKHHSAPLETAESEAAPDDDPDAFDFGANVRNPSKGISAKADIEKKSSKLVTLGHLVSIVYRASATGRRRVLRWGVRKAPILAYVPSTGRLAIVFSPRVVGPGSHFGSTAYAQTHWGLEPVGDLVAGEVLAGKAPRLGVAHEITYATRKGVDVDLVDYWHVFGDYGTEKAWKFLPPMLAGATVDGRPLVRLDGGTYRVTEHGIVG